MRVNLITRSSNQHTSGAKAIPLVLKIRPSCGMPGDYECSTDSAALLSMLRRKTDLPGSVIDRFEERMQSAFHAHLLGVELSDQVLTEIGYFID